MTIGPSGAPEASKLALHKADARVISLEDLIWLCVRHIKLLALGPLATAAVVYGLVSIVPAWYTSVSYLRVSHAGARVADALMRSPPVIDRVVAGLNVSQNETEIRRQLLDNRQIVVAEGNLASAARLFRLEYTDKDPLIARQINSLFIDAWLASAELGTSQRAALTADINAKTALLKDMSREIEGLEKNLLPQASADRQDDAVALINSLAEKRATETDKLAALTAELNAASRENVFAGPSLPTIPTWPKKGVIAVLAGVVSALILLIVVVLRRPHSASRPVLQQR